MNPIAIIQFPGSNTERETTMACDRVGMKSDEFLWNAPPPSLKKYSGYITVGGFSYEDRSRAGIIAALDPIMNQVKKESSKGKPVLGICNGAQVLVESGLVPGCKDNKPYLSLTDNKRVKNNRVVGVGYYNAWTNLKMPGDPNRSAFTRHLKTNDYIRIPLAHGEGRFIIPEDLLNEMIKNNQTLFQYCDSNGSIENEFPTNPNGSIYNLAAVCNPAGNVMAMMPHPERTKEGDVIFSSMKEYIRESIPVSNHTPSYNNARQDIVNFTPNPKASYWRISALITDNTASTVQQTLQNLNCQVNINRQIFWEIEADHNKDQILRKIDQSGELYNSNKEYIDNNKNHNYDLSLLVLQKDDVNARMKYESLSNRFEINGINKITKGVVWNISLISGNINDVLKQIINTNILYNQQSHECYRIN